ncbi:MAG: LLM class flavin-dependent oxidoreductase [Candidatus Odinarchaeota archaeon]|nr:LLM class flavin-dependent oxidoreductase [Candidatus Odinarchaeota archaeon]
MSDRINFAVDLIPPEPTQVPVLSKLFEENDFDTLYIADVDFERDVYVSLTQAVLSTKRIKIGTGVTNPLTRHPITTAIAISTLSELSGGRMVLALGTGDYHIMRKLSLLPEKPLRALKEAVFIIREFLENKEINFEGTYFKVFNTKAKEENKYNIPILIAGKGQMLLKLAGRIGDGVYLDAIPLPLVEEIKSLISVGAKKAGKSVDDLYLVNVIPIAISNNKEEALRLAAPQTIYAIGSLPEYIHQKLGIDEEVIKAVREALPDFEKAAKHLPLDVIEMFSIIGTGEECIEKIDKFRKKGVNELAFILPKVKNLPDFVNLLHAKVIMYFKEM